MNKWKRLKTFDEYMISNDEHRHVEDMKKALDKGINLSQYTIDLFKTHTLYRFPNNRGASIVCGSATDDGYELAVVQFTDKHNFDKFIIDNDNKVTKTYGTIYTDYDKTPKILRRIMKLKKVNL